MNRYRHLHRAQQSPIDLGKLVEPQKCRPGKLAWLSAAAALVLLAALVWLAMPPAESPKSLAKQEPIDPPTPVEPQPVEAEPVEMKEPRKLIPATPARWTTTSAPSSGGWHLPARSFPSRR